jgi:purine nucleosidase
VVELSGRRDVPVFAGCARPLMRAPITAEYVHGPTGLDGYTLPPPTLPLQAGHGVDFIIETVMAAEPGAITLCTLGPLTDVAMALAKAPAIAPRLGEIVMMGGAYFEVGNRTPAAEFNIIADPEAAQAVISSGVPVTMLPLDVTHQVLSTPARLDAIAALGNRAGRAVRGFLSFSEGFDLGKYGWQGAPLHDPCVIAYLLKPELFSGKLVNVEIETASPLTLGMTVADWWGVTARRKNVRFMRSVDADGFFALLTERLARLP